MRNLRSSHNLINQSEPRSQSSPPLRVLHFAPKQCWPPDTGAKLRNYHLAREMARNARVTYLCFSEDPAASTAGLEHVCERIITVPREPGYTFTKILRGIAGRAPLNVLNYTTRAMKRRLARLLDEQDFDIVQVESLLLADYLPIIRLARSRPLAVCDWHNVDSEVIERYGRHAPGALRRLYARATARRMAALERRSLSQFDAHIVVSERDRAQLLGLASNARIFVVDNGVDVNHLCDEEIERAYSAWLVNAESNRTSKNSPTSEQQTGETRRNRVVFVGSMDYHANADACLYFARKVWPELRSRKPDLVFTIVGRNPSEEIRALGNLPGVEVTGTVEDVRPYYREALAAIVPLRIGGGSRLKILEAMAAGVPVISSRLGAEGIDASDGENILIAGTADEFRRALFEIVENRTLRHKLATAARSFVSARYDWSALGETLLDTHAGLLAHARRPDSTGNVSKAMAEVNA